jgi:hypothetical protein
MFNFVHHVRILVHDADGPCTCTLRINTPASPADHFRSKKSYKRGALIATQWPFPPS